ncbi:MAG: hypothetical protein ACAH88_10295 [Roseimicrobium sp.]
MFFVKTEINWISVIMGLWCAATVVWLYAVTFGRSKEVRVYNRTTGGYEMKLSRHALFFMSAKTWGWIFVAIALAGSVLLPQAPMPKRSAATVNEPGENTFHEANLAITSGRNGVALGNTKSAIQLATDFSKTLKLLREAGVEKSKKGENAISLTKGEFITYCHLTTETCAFLVHVPELRNFSSDAKKFIADAAWHSATAAVLEMPDPPERLAVGIRGVLLYDAILIGDVVSSGRDAEDGIDKRLGGSDKEALHPFFAEITKKEVAAGVDDESPGDKPPTATPPSEPSPKIATANDVSATAEKAPMAAAETKAPEAPPTPAASVPATSPPAEVALPTPVRDWRSADGRLLRASLLGFNESGTSARVKREDGTEFEVALDKFAPEDQEQLKRLHQLSRSKGS